jgi:uncharacterized protein (DUF1697 family)
MTVQIALLRGINVGRSNRVPMPQLRAHLTELGYGDVRTIVQSGNIVLESAVEGGRLERDLQTAIAQRFGVDTPVVVRTAAQLAQVVADNPFAEAADDPRRFQVSFLAQPCPAAEARELMAADIGRERVAVAGREIYSWHVDGIQSSPLAQLLAKRVSVTATARNWNTVLKLLALTADADG